MLKKYLNDHNISIYKLSELSGVPYTTLNELVNNKKNINDCKIKTIESIAAALNLSIESFLNFFNDQQSLLSNSWDECRNNIYYFPVIIRNDNYDYKRIHPLMQKKINDLYDSLACEEVISKIIVFGSSVNIRCNKNSDIDVAVLLKDDFFNNDNKNKISEKIQEITDYNADIIWLNTIDKDSQLYKNINNLGVTIYE